MRARLCTALLLFVAVPLAAQGTARRDSTALSSSSSDAPARPVPAPLVTRRDLLWLGAGTGFTLLAHRVDLQVRDEVRSRGWQTNRVLDTVEPVGDVWGGGAAVGAGLALWLGGLKARNGDVATTGFRALEAITVSGAITAVLKGTVGRARPRVDSTHAWNAEAFRGFRRSGGDYKSMASGHATAAFAFATAVTGEVRRRRPERAMLVGITSYTLAGATAYARIHENAHWLSDVTMGATIGAVSGWAVSRWHDTRPGNAIDARFLGPVMSPLVTRGPQGDARLGATISWR